MDERRGFGAALLVGEPDVVAFMVETYELMWLPVEPRTSNHSTRGEITDDLAS
ncbi:hypothetical protein ACIGQE_28080 [Streptomyces sp. NPDC053429]|uniref:hypothetical protein n=1 Tax=Streptomyces sp. NPDC053429 TaxID=3365702 RepID=UPI0037CF3BCB